MYLENDNNEGIVLSKYVDNATYLLKILSILYADDTVLLSEKYADMQHSLRIFADYCIHWKLTINEEKSKIVIFGRDRNKYKFYLNGLLLEKVKQFKYLGVVFSHNGRFLNTIRNNLQKARKASFGIAKRSRALNLSPSCELHILNTVVKPILLYGCEIFCFDNYSVLEKFYLQCIKRILRVNKTTPDYMVYGESGCMPLYVDIIERALSFYVKTKYTQPHSLQYKLQQNLHNIYGINCRSSPYLQYIKRHLDNLGYTYIFYNADTQGTTVKAIINLLKRTIKDQYIQQWNATLISSSKATFYRTIKKSFHLEPYLDLLPPKYRILITRFRTSNHRLPIETGR